MWPDVNIFRLYIFIYIYTSLMVMVNVFTLKSCRLAFDFTILPPKHEGSNYKEETWLIKLLFIFCVFEMQMYPVLRGRHAIFKCSRRENYFQTIEDPRCPLLGSVVSDSRTRHAVVGVSYVFLEGDGGVRFVRMCLQRASCKPRSSESYLCYTVMLYKCTRKNVSLASYEQVS